MKHYGAIGYAVTSENPEGSGIWVEEITERNYYMDISKNTRMIVTASDKINDNVNISNTVSIVADPYAYENFHAIRYVKFMGSKWKVNTIDASSYPRLSLTLGGLYNGK